MRKPVPRDEYVPDRMIGPPRWRYRTSASRRHRAAMLTFALIVLLGVAVMAGMWWLESAAGLSTFVQVQVWLVPTAIVLVWTIAHPSVAESSDERDHQTWPGFAIRYGLAGEDQLRPLPVRVAVAVVFGAPVGWALVIVGILTLLGVTE